MKPQRNMSAANKVMVRNMSGREVAGLTKARAIKTLVSEIRNMPIVIINWKSVPIDPRMDAGAVSDRKRGTTKDATPTPKPRAKRQAESTGNGGSKAEYAEAAVKMKPAKSRLFLRPRKRAKIPESSAPTMPPVARMDE